MASDDLTLLNLCVRVRGGSDDEDDGGDTNDEDDENEVEEETWEGWAYELHASPDTYYLDDDMLRSYSHMLDEIEHNPPWDPDGELTSDTSWDADDIRARVKEWWDE
eukprot:SAG11_NODE_1957_length_4002_cov_4.816551_2_plen_107_part_00